MSNIGHFEPVASQLAEKRARNDYSTCDFKIVLRNGQCEMVHSIVVAPQSKTIQMLVEERRDCINLSKFDENCVKSIVDWMYTDNIHLSLINLPKILKIAEFLKMYELQKILENYLIRLASEKNKAVPVLNIATATSFSIPDETLEAIISKISPCFDATYNLTFNSIQTIMTSRMKMNKKIGFVNMVMRWMNHKKADAKCKSIMTQSLYIDGIDQDLLNDICQFILDNPHRRLLLENGQIKFEKMTIAEQIKKAIPSKDYRSQLTSAPRSSKVSKSQVSMILRIEDPFRSCQPPIMHRTQSEVEHIQSMPDPFEHPVFSQPEIPKFSKLSESQISMLEKTEDPFQNSPVKLQRVDKNDDSLVLPVQTKISQPVCFLLAMNNGGNSSTREMVRPSTSASKKSIEKKTEKSNFDSVCLY